MFNRCPNAKFKTWVDSFNNKDKMNNHDRANLEFMLSADKVTLAEWYNSLSEDDLAYANELLQAARIELSMRMVEMCDNVPNTETAKSILDKYRLNK